MQERMQEYEEDKIVQEEEIVILRQEVIHMLEASEKEQHIIKVMMIQVEEEVDMEVVSREIVMEEVDPIMS